VSVAYRSVAFRPLVTAGAAGVMLCGLFFIPSAHGAAPHDPAHRTGQSPVSTGRSGTSDDAAHADLRDADGSGSQDLDGSGSNGLSGSGPQDPAAPGTARSAVFARQSTRASRQLALGETPASGATPYVVGGASALCVGAAFVTRAVRREDGTAYGFPLRPEGR
jgi:hypothetical protein